MLKVNEIFSSIQGEGKYLGTPVLFIRLSGCTQKCSFCDSKYHTEYTEYTTDKLVKRILKEKNKIIVWSGGEPLMQLSDIQNVIDELCNYDIYSHHMETNGDLITEEMLDKLWHECYFNYMCISPKTLATAKRVNTIIKSLSGKNIQELNILDIKIVTDMEKTGIDMLKYATMLMPLSTYNIENDLKIKHKVWNYCVKHNLKYTPRIHVELFGQKRGI